MGLIEPSDMPRIPGTKVPEAFYLVTLEPAPLAGMAYPRWEGLVWEALAAIGIKHVVCLTDESCPYDPSPLSVLTSIRMDDLVGGAMPEDPLLEGEKIRRVAADVLARVRVGEGVVVHCAGGTGRTGTVLGCVLRGLGYGGREVLGYLDRLTRLRGQGGWPESPWHAQVVTSYVP